MKQNNEQHIFWNHGHVRIAGQGQFVNYTELLDVNGHMLRLRLCSQQTEQVAERWDGAQWREVATRPYPDTDPNCGYKPGGASMRDFRQDRDALLCDVAFVLRFPKD
jgi:hypothetical protein